MKKGFTITLLVITCVCFFYDKHYRWWHDNWKSTINADGYGYYAYLPCVFVLHSFDYEKIISAERKLRPISYDEAQNPFPDNNGKHIDKFFAGESVLLFPFFLLALVLARLFGFDTDGYSLPFQIAVDIGAFFYLLIGLIFIRKLLKEYGFSELIICATALVLVLGTNLLYYATLEPSMSHIYCFSLTAIFLYYIKTCFTSFSIASIAKASAAFCLLLIVRPTNINDLVIIPFLAGDFASLKKFFGTIFKPKVLLAILAVSLPILFIQGIIWKIETGHFFYWSYRGEGFYFLAPEIRAFLFSFRNGWFIYTPLMLLFLTGGLILLYRKSVYQFITFLLFFLFSVYLLSSWYAWYYGGFGKRAMVDYYAAYAILIALCLTFINKTSTLRIISSVIIGFLIYVNVTQIRQYFNFILPNEYMNSARYWHVFLRTDSKYVCIYEHHPPADLNMINYSFSNGFEYKEWGNNNSNCITDENAHTDRHSARIGDKAHSSPVLALKTGDFPAQQNLFMYVETAIYMTDSANDANLVMALQTKDGNVYSTTKIPLKEIVPYYSDWEDIDKTLPVPPFKNSDDSLKIYFSATRGKTFIDDERISFGVKK